VAPPGDLGDDARPRVEDIAAFRVPGDRLIKLHVATWHAGPHFVHDECLFVNLENLDTNRRDFHAVPLPVECRYRLSAARRREAGIDTFWQPLTNGQSENLVVGCMLDQALFRRAEWWRWMASELGELR
jgi:hypothetical protein